MSGRYYFLLLTLLLLLPFPALAAENGQVSRKEFEELKSAYEGLKIEVEELKRSQQIQISVPKAPPPVPPIASISEEEIQSLKDEIDGVRPGTSNFLITGYGFSSYENKQHDTSTFSYGFTPVFLYRMNEKLLFEGAFEVEIEDGEARVEVEYADVSYILNQYITVGAGKFLSPFGYFQERLHPDWINKLPDNPLGYGEGANRLAPEAQIGAQVRGGIPLFFGTAANYAVFMSNGPILRTGAANAGQLNFSNNRDTNSNKAFGGRIGFLPIPGLEGGYSFEAARAGDRVAGTGSEFGKVDALLQGFDVNLVRELDLIAGTIDFRAERIWSDVDSVDYGTPGGAFKNDRWAQYFQVAYRPTKLKDSVLRNFEPVFRYDQIHHPAGAPYNIGETRYTIGLNYWLDPNIVIKLAYQNDDKEQNSQDQGGFIGEIATAF